MVTTTLIGRLGNQMFEIAAAYAHSLRTGTNFYCPKKSQAPQIWPTYFNHLPVLPANTSARHVYKEKSHSYTEIPLELTNVRLEGYFQSEKYFCNYRQQIIDLFGLPWELKKGWVSIHVRRTDYLQFSNQFPVITKEYILSAIDYLSKFGSYNFLFYSDDIKWCRETFGTFPVHFSNGGQPLNELASMSCCEHNIIANSSFSWWAAWLNQNPEKVVIAPRTWFGPGNAHLDTKDLCPDKWIRL